MTALRAALFDDILQDEDGAFSPHDPAFKRAVDAVFDLDDQGKRLNLEISDKPYEALIRISQELHQFGVSNNLASEFVDAIEAQAVHLGVDFTKKEKPTPMTIALRVVDEEPVLDPGKTHFMVAWDRDGKHGGEYSQMMMKLGINGTQSSHTNVPKFEELFAAGKKQYLIAHFEKLEGEGVGSLDQAGVAMATLVEAVGVAAAESRGAEEIKQTIAAGTVKPEIVQLIDSVATLNHLTTVAQAPQTSEQTAPKIVEVKNQIVNLTSTISKTDAIPSVVAKAVVKAYEKTEATPAAAAPQKQTATMAVPKVDNTQPVPIASAKPAQMQASVQAAPANQQAGPAKIDVKQAVPTEIAKQAPPVTASQSVQTQQMSQAPAAQAQAPVQVTPVVQMVQPQVQIPVQQQVKPTAAVVMQVQPVVQGVVQSQKSPQVVQVQAQIPIQQHVQPVQAAVKPQAMVLPQQQAQPIAKQNPVQPQMQQPVQKAAQVVQAQVQAPAQQPQQTQPVQAAKVQVSQQPTAPAQHHPQNPVGAAPIKPVLVIQAPKQVQIVQNPPKDVPPPVRHEIKQDIVKDVPRQIVETPKSVPSYTQHQNGPASDIQKPPPAFRQEVTVPPAKFERAEPSHPHQPEPAPFKPEREIFHVTNNSVQRVSESHVPLNKPVEYAASTINKSYASAPAVSHVTPVHHDYKAPVEPAVNKTPSYTPPAQDYSRKPDAISPIKLSNDFKTVCDRCPTKACASCNTMAPRLQI